jgi:hypothetical protein
LGTHVANNAHSGAQFGLGEFAALLVDPDNGEEHCATVGLIQWFPSSWLDRHGNAAAIAAAIDDGRN